MTHNLLLLLFCSWFCYCIKGNSQATSMPFLWLMGLKGSYVPCKWNEASPKGQDATVHNQIDQLKRYYQKTFNVPAHCRGVGLHDLWRKPSTNPDAKKNSNSLYEMKPHVQDVFGRAIATSALRTGYLMQQRMTPWGSVGRWDSAPSYLTALEGAPCKGSHKDIVTAPSYPI